METLKLLLKEEQAEWEYDDEADVLYISFGKPRKAVTRDLGSGLLLRYDEYSKEIVGITITGAKRVLSSEVPVTT